MINQFNMQPIYSSIDELHAMTTRFCPINNIIGTWDSYRTIFVGPETVGYFL